MMGPRLRLVTSLVRSLQHPPSSISPFLLPFLYQYRSASILSSLSDNRDAYQKRIRLGRGPSSGKGKTSGRGHKGQKQHGKVPFGFNGGQTKLEVARGPRGFVNVFSDDMIPLNLDRLQVWIDRGRIDPTRPITIKELAKSRCANNIKDGVKLLARGSTQLSQPINIIVSRASTSAIAAVEAAGGSVTTRYYTRSAILRIRRGLIDPANSLLSGPSMGAVPVVGAGEGGFQNRLPDPTSRKDLEYYRDYAHRGYLSYQVGEREGPSLFHRLPGDGKTRKQNASVRKTGGPENKIW